MNDEMKQVASRIRELREICGCSEEELAQEVGVDILQYKNYEIDGKDIPISVLYHISQKFGVDMSEILTGKSARLNTFEICRRGKGKTIDRYTGYKYQSLAPLFKQKIMEPLLVTLDPSDSPAPLVTHPGQEFNLVLEGTIIFTYDNASHTLNEGDTVYFDPSHPHGQKVIGDKKARFLTVITE